jgi:hypothetical protein
MFAPPHFRDVPHAWLSVLPPAPFSPVAGSDRRDGISDSGALAGNHSAVPKSGRGVGQTNDSPPLILQKPDAPLRTATQPTPHAWLMDITPTLPMLSVPHQRQQRNFPSTMPHTDWHMPDAVPIDWVPPRDVVAGKSSARSLMQPQPLAQRLLPGPTFERLIEYAVKGVPADCGPDWPKEAINNARQAGPHVSALTEENVELIWDEIGYQEQAGFIRRVREEDLFQHPFPAALKISRLAVVPQRNRRRRLILNLSAGVEMQSVKHPGARRKTKCAQPSVNETSAPASDQAAVKRLGTTLLDALIFQFECPCQWIATWSKIDLSDGFWRMIVESGKEINFVYQLPEYHKQPGKWFVIPSALQMGWMNSPAYFCFATEAGQIVIQRLLALMIDSGALPNHTHESLCATVTTQTWQKPTELLVFLRVFVDDFIQAVAGPASRPSQSAEELWVARAALHGVHSIFPNPEITQHLGGRDSISVKKLEKGDGKFLPQKIVLGFLFDGQPGAQRTIGLPKEKADSYIEHIRGALDNARHYISKTEFQKLHGRLAHALTIMPCMTGFMSELNRVLAAACITVGLGKHSKLRRILEDYVFFLSRAHTNPSHITELVGPALPHIYGYTDASRTGMGGTLLPATKWIAPTVWRLQYPPDIVELFDNRHISINDLELAANFLTERIGEYELAGDMQGLNSWLGSDNTATVLWKTKKSTCAKAESHFAPQALRAEALLQRHTRQGPQDIGHIAGTSNTMGDFPT